MKNEGIEDIKNRLQNFYSIDEITWTDVIEAAPGIWVYKNVIPKNIIEKLESVLLNPNNKYTYRDSLVGYGVKIPEYRDCVDFKFKRSDIDNDKSETADKLREIWDEVYFRQLQAVKHYCSRFNIGELRYWEAINFVKYAEGHHFQEHHDNGYSYNCILSAVSYPNDDYDGGELYFRLQDLKIKPEAGDLYLFPSNFMYPHQAMPVKSGTKYAIVTMLDYSDKFHKPEFYQETGS